MTLAPFSMRVGDRIIAGQDRDDQRRVAVGPALVDRGALGQERLDSRKITLACRIVQRPRLD